ncbi:cleavage stimulation factor subunit 1 [Lingula anatina]|uniref:Cleavage stimulation factor 50 kDa subunit n=1 Tax=Lingula anatina TaxID=7574 RepID=A0A1S3J3B2_LINAN|nr:cleavage stimulation factor subunit 1 [Lingula anatina]XP_013404354.1 cleavage stimulation factor subunit 1 [Lingula anatina]|eukprot:XP_013388489.1 cleavage stimulation factor subunit 1 [Lingula anatina]
MSSSVDVKDRQYMYRLVISQLFYDGYQSLAVNLSNLVKATPACPPSDKLMHVVKLGLQAEEENSEQDKLKGDVTAPGSGIDLEFETDVQRFASDISQYETCYVTAHKAPCRAGVFNKTGQLIATGSGDASIKILDVERMLAKSAIPADQMAQETPQQQMENHPVIRTLYDHTDEVTCVDFHPYRQVLVSGSKDYGVKFFEFSKPSVKKAFKSIQEASPVRCLNFHPSGDYLIVGTQHPTVRLYDVNTFQCFVASNPKEQHTAPVTSVKWSPCAKMYVSSSKDGDLKLWDGVSNKCVNTFKRAHDGHEVCSAVFSRNSKYVLTCGKDSLVKLWELSTSRCLIAYTGAGTTGKMEHRTQAVFNHTEDYVLFPDEATTSLCCWDSRNADRQKLLALSHNNVIPCIVHSPTGPAFLTCSDDFRARFWYKKALD